MAIVLQLAADAPLTPEEKVLKKKGCIIRKMKEVGTLVDFTYLFYPINHILL